MRLYILSLIGCVAVGQLWVSPIHAASASREALIITKVTVIDTVTAFGIQTWTLWFWTIASRRWGARRR
jgi:hypothetical protein